MAFLNNTKYKEIREAAKNGNEKALKILQAIRKNALQNDLDGLVDDYYKIDSVPVETPPQIEEEPIEEQQPIVEETVVEEETPAPAPEIDDEALAKDFDGLIDDDEIDDISFANFLSNKKKDGIRSRKNADYFKAYSPEIRQAYMDNSINSYKNKFNNKLKDIDRNYRDMDNAITGYAKDIDLMLDDDIELNMDEAGKAYNDLIDDEDTMHGFSRSWDEADRISVEEALKGLIAKYGKKNVIAALNTLRNDNNGYRDYLNNRIDTSISGYSKKLENLLK